MEQINNYSVSNMYHREYELIWVGRLNKLKMYFFFLSQEKPSGHLTSDGGTFRFSDGLGKLSF